MKRTGILIGLALSVQAIISVMVNTYLPSHLGAQGVAASLIGVVLTWDNYLAILSVGILSAFSDRTWTRLGRRKPWVLGAAPVAVVMLMLLPSTTHVGLLLFFLFVLNLANASIRINAQALVADRIPAKHQPFINGVVQTVLALVVIVAMVASSVVMTTSAGLFGTFGAVSVLVLLVVCAVLPVREDETAVTTTVNPIQQATAIGRSIWTNRSSWWAIGGLFFALVTLTTVEAWIADIGQRALNIPEDQIASILAVGALALLIGSIPAGLVARRFGTVLVVRGSVGVLALVYLAGAFIVRDLSGLMVLMLCSGFISAALYTTTIPLLYENVPLNSSNIGAFTGFYFVIYNLAAAIGPQVGGLLIDATGSHFTVFGLAGAGALVSFVLCCVPLLRRRGGRVGVEAPGTLVP